MAIVAGLFSGKVRPFDPGGERTGIYKEARREVMITKLGIEGDQQADKRYHGGTEKAVHQFSAHGYKVLREEFSSLIDKLTPGSFGENLATDFMSDSNVFIGDTYRVNKVLLQVSEPRKPCWKINRKFDAENLSVFVEQHGITGWYYRVLEPGTVQLGDKMELEERVNEQASIARFTQISTQHRPSLDDVGQLIDVRGLSPAWKKRLEKRLVFLSQLK